LYQRNACDVAAGKFEHTQREIEAIEGLAHVGLRGSLHRVLISVSPVWKGLEFGNHAAGEKLVTIYSEASIGSVHNKTPIRLKQIYVDKSAFRSARKEPSRYSIEAVEQLGES
jgi:hypothetical protein